MSNSGLVYGRNLLDRPESQQPWPKVGKKTGVDGAKVGGFLLTVFSISNYIILDIYKVSLHDSFTLSGGHSCRGLWGLVLDQISTHQLRNDVQIAALIPRLGPAGGSSAPKWPISIHLKQMLFERLTADSGLTSVCPAYARYIPTLQHSVYLVNATSFLKYENTVLLVLCFRVFVKPKPGTEGNHILSWWRADLDRNVTMRQIYNPIR